MEEHYIKDVGKITYVYGVNLEEHKMVIEKQQKRIVELEQELTEKDKEIECLNKRIDRYENMFRSRVNRTGDMQKDIELYINQLAIQELEKVKEYNAQRIYGNDLVDKFIDKRINALKGGRR